MHRELLILLRHLAGIQQGIDRQLRAQQQEIASLQTALMLSRAALVLNMTRRNWLAQSARPPASPGETPAEADALPAVLPSKRRAAPDMRQSISALAAEVVICQSGCLSHDAYWRVQEYCLRHGKRCLLLESDEVSALLPLPESSTS